jgi:hypothetical protein
MKYVKEYRAMPEYVKEYRTLPVFPNIQQER